MKQGFTFVEVLVALVVAALLLSVAGSAVITSLRAEQTADRLREGAFLIQQTATEIHLGAAATGLLAREDSDWKTETDLVPAGPADDVTLWRVWTLSPNDRPSLRVMMAIREER